MIVDGVMTGLAVVTSAPSNVSYVDNIGLQISWTGNPTGDIEILGSIDGENFVPLTFNPIVTQPSGTAGDTLIDLNQYPFPWIQVQYTNASGDGTLQVWISGKDLN